MAGKLYLQVLQQRDDIDIIANNATATTENVKVTIYLKVLNL